METIYQFIIANQTKAPWIIFSLYLLAGMNIPICIDILVIISAVIAAMSPEMLWPLFLSAFLGCYFSAWIAYGIGRAFGRKLLKVKWISKILPEEKIKKMEKFYSRKGFLTLLIGRFIPFGIRNAIFMSTGISRSSFIRFALRDLFPAFFWTFVCFFIFYFLGANYESLTHYLKRAHVILFLALSVTVITVFWYKKRKKLLQSKP